MIATPCHDSIIEPINPASILKSYVKLIETLVATTTSLNPSSPNDALIKLSTAIGFTHVFYTRISLRQKDSTIQECLITNLPSEIAKNLHNQVLNHIEHQKWQVHCSTITTASEPTSAIIEVNPSTRHNEMIEHLTLFTPSTSGAIDIYAFSSNSDKTRPSTIGREERAIIDATVIHFKHVKDFLFPTPALKNASSRPRKLLSNRENQVLSLVAHGQTTAEISNTLGITTKGVEFHLSSCKRKLNVKNRTHAVTKALLIGILSSIAWPTTLTTRRAPPISAANT